MNVPMFEQAGLAVRSPQGEAELLQYVRSLTIDRDGDGIAEVSGFARATAPGSGWVTSTSTVAASWTSRGCRPSARTRAGEPWRFSER